MNIEDENNNDQIFIYFDGDDIGGKIELLLLDGRLDEARLESERISDACIQLRNNLSQKYGVKVRLFGGDDLIVSFSSGQLSIDEIEVFRSEYQRISGSTISAGSGKSVAEMLDNLRRAKLSGKNLFIGAVQ